MNRVRGRPHVRLPGASVVPGILLLLACDTGAPARVEAPADPALGEIAMRMAGPNEAALMVDVFLNGEGPYEFVLDTGATFTCVSRPRAEELDLPARRGATGFGAGIGGTGRVDLVRVDSLRVGEARAFDLTACVLDLDHLDVLGTEIDGLLGLNVLREFTVTLDFERGVIRLE